MLGHDLSKELASIDHELTVALDEALAGADEAIEALTHRLSIAQNLGRQDLVARVTGLLEPLVCRQESLRAMRSTLVGHPQPEPEALPEAVAEAPAPMGEPELSQGVPTAVDEAPAPEEPSPEAERLPAPATYQPPVTIATPRRKSSLTRTHFRRRESECYARERELLGTRGWSASLECRIKGLSCECRALIQAADELGEDDGNLWTTLELLRERFSLEAAVTDFFAFNRGRIHPVETWSDLGEAFTLMGDAHECLDWLASGPAIDREHRELLVEACAATEAWAYRTIEEKGLGVIDASQRELHHLIEREFSDVFIPWWLSRGEGVRSTGEVAKAARELPGHFKTLRQRVENSQRRAEAEQALLSNIASPGDFETTLYPAILRCLEAGIPASNPNLVKACAPYRQALYELGDPTLMKLIQYVDQHLQRQRTMAERDEEEEDRTDDPEYRTWLEGVRSVLRGKTLMFVGGKTKHANKEALERELELRELIWPDAEPDTAASAFTDDVRRAEVVCYLIRWSRHSYKKVIDFAKSQGKQTVTLKAGYGVRRIVHDLYHQLCA